MGCMAQRGPRMCPKKLTSKNVSKEGPQRGPRMCPELAKCLEYRS